MSYKSLIWFLLNTFILLMFVGYLLIGLYEDQHEIASQIDHRFKSYDMFYILDKWNGDCIDTTVEDVTEYYEGRETPLSTELKVGKWVCK